MPEKPKRTIRLGQLISTHSVGGILDIGDESLICKDISGAQWGRDKELEELELPRLSTRLQGKKLKHPKAAQNGFRTHGSKVKFDRFPRWLFCPNCNRMHFIDSVEARRLKGKIPVCGNPRCNSRFLVPMRWVVACENGHLDDVPWERWAHSGKKETNTCRSKKLEFRENKSKGGGLASLSVKCLECGAERSFQDLETEYALKSIGYKCRGKQPWQTAMDNIQQCSATPRILQRGASNLYFPSTVSAISIPPLIEETAGNLESDIKNHKLYEYLVSSDEINMTIVEMMSDELGCTKEEIISSIKNEGMEISSWTSAAKELAQEEWEALVTPFQDDQFIAEKIEPVVNDLDEKEILDNLSVVTLVKKLREVRAFRGFHRVQPGDDSKLVPPDLGKGLNWLPAYEVYGEGIFLAIRNEKIEAWLEENESFVRKRMEQLVKRHDIYQMAWLRENLTPKFVMLHTFSHLLIRQLTFEAGYSASSLREKIYCSEGDGFDMSGVLVYTADSDSEGSLGGLVAQGGKERLIPLVRTALKRGLWCSSDPICIESEGQGYKMLNLAGCHACSLLAETSCEFMNVFLDRGLLFGTPEKPDAGFFSYIRNTE